MLTVQQLKEIYEISEEKATAWLPYILEAMKVAEINTYKRAAAFLAQIGHESGRLKYTREIWGDTKQQLKYEGTPLGISLGNTEVGDGKKYRGRGLIQITGRYNYRIISKRMKELYQGSPDFEAEPEKLEQPLWASVSAAIYWKDKGLNAFADSGDFTSLTKKINGGINGLLDRQELYLTALAVLDYN